MRGFWKVSILLILFPRNKCFKQRIVSISSLIPSSIPSLSFSSSSSSLSLSTSSIPSFTDTSSSSSSSSIPSFTDTSSSSSSSSSIPSYTDTSSSSSSFSLSSFTNKELPIRPSIDDVENISFGRKAKKRGVGSRGVPHRLNSEERKEFDLSKKRKYLITRNTGFRKERQDSPLANTYRLYCDSYAIPAISIQKFTNENGSADELMIDYSPLRTNQNLNELTKTIIDISSKYNDSILNIEDTNIQTLGFENYEISLTEHSIWTIPVTGTRITFKDRKNCKQLAEELTIIFNLVKQQ